MKKIRDSKTGQYLSEETATKMDASTFTQETEFDKEHFLSVIYETLKHHSYVAVNSEEEVVALKDIKSVFNDFGAKLK